MELPKIYFDTIELIDGIIEKAWKSYRGGISDCKRSLENKKLDVEDIKMSIEKLNGEKREDRQKYEQYCNQLKDVFNELCEGNKHSMRELIDYLNCKRLGIDPSILQTIKEEPISAFETNELLNALEEDHFETTYPTEDVDALFVPLDLPDIPSDNPIQPGDLETHKNFPK